MTTNITRIPNLEVSQLLMTKYDTLPPALRKALQDAPYNFSIKPERLNNISNDGMEEVNEIERMLPAVIRSSAKAAYGPDHPQAKEKL